MTAKTSGGRDEMGWSAFRRSFNSSNDLMSALMDSSNALMSVSMACCKDSLELSWAGFIKTEIA